MMKPKGTIPLPYFNGFQKEEGVEREFAPLLPPTCRLKLVRESTSNYTPQSIKCFRDVAALLRPLLADKDREHLVCLILDTKNHVTASHVIAIGTLDKVLVSPREIFKVAILANARAIILAHNHPSGDISPSLEDIETTSRIAQAGRLLDIELLDHVIVGEGCASLKATHSKAFS